MRSLNHWMFSNPLKLKLKVSLERKLKLLKLTMVVSTMVDMMDRVYNVQGLLQDICRDVKLFLSTPSRLVAKSYCKKDDFCYEEIFLLVTMFKSIKVFLSITTHPTYEL